MKSLSTSTVTRWLVTLLPGLLIYFCPVAGLSDAQRHLLAFFVVTILALAIQPARLGTIMFLSLTGIAWTGTLTPTETFSGFSYPTVWLIFAAFVFAQAVTQTGLGSRIAYFFIARLGSRSLPLGYAIAASNFVLAPFVPSDTARGGIIAPVVRGVAQILGSEPATNARTGAYLTLVGFHTNYIASAMFLTSMVGNPLIAKLAGDIAHVELTWIHWAAASLVPGLLTFLFLPWLLHYLQPPHKADTSHARDFAREKLAEMGPPRRAEKLLFFILLFVIAGWITSPWHGVTNTIVALVGVCALLMSRVLEWDDILGNKRAWEVLIWFATLLMMADQLSRQGVMQILFGSVFDTIHGWPWAFGLAAVVLGYFYAHYGFASLTAQISALFPIFLTAGIAAGAPAALVAWSLAFCSSLNAGLTHFGTGSAPLYYGEGYVPQRTWWSVGFIISLVNLAVWIGLGSIWWNLIGLW